MPTKIVNEYQKTKPQGFPELELVNELQETKPQGILELELVCELVWELVWGPRNSILALPRSIFNSGKP